MVGQRRDQAVRRLPAVLGREDPEPARRGQPRWADCRGRGTRRSASASSVRRFDGKTIFEAQTKTPSSRTARACPGLPAAPTRSGTLRTSTRTTRSVPKGARHGSTRPGRRASVHKTWFFYLARICNHCSYPACLAACPRKAIYKRPEDGIVLIDQEQCRGYRKCVEACPYKKTMYRGNTRVSPRSASPATRASRARIPRAGANPMETRCMAACIGQIRMQGLVKIERGRQAGRRTDRTRSTTWSTWRRSHLPLYPQFGTQPNGYYIPPRWVPSAYLEADVRTRRRRR